MYIRRDFSLSFAEQDYIAFHGERFLRLLAKPGVRDEFEEALAEIQELVQPAACIGEVAVKRFVHERIELDGGARLSGGPLVEVMGGAEQLLVAVCTVGQAVDDRLRALKAEGKGFYMLVLDELASWAVDQVRQQLCQDFEIEQRAQGWHTSTMLSPGESAWPVQEQAVLFNLVDAAQIGVTLSPGMVMYPLKSLSLIVGVGPQPMGTPGLVNCDYCTMKDRCKYAYTGGHGMIALN